MKRDIRDLSFEEIKKVVLELGEPAHRSRQILLWLYDKNAVSFDEMTDLPGRVIEKLNNMFHACSIKVRKRLMSGDGTEKFVWELADGKLIESVIISSGKRKTLCISSQVGCKFGCSFCASGMKGFFRDLTPGEILGQICLAQKLSGHRMTNLVFMGMGEPLDNYENLERSINLINDPMGIGLGARKITVSTCGLVPGILRLKGIDLQVELSVSLHAPNDKLRNKLVPVNRKYPISELVKACGEYNETTGRVITLEYTMIKGVNDSPVCASETSDIALSFRSKVNLIPCSVIPGALYRPSDEGDINKFARILRSKKVNVTIRNSKGPDISASCGQLAIRRSRGT